MTVITKFKAIHNLVGGQMSWDGDVTYLDGQTPPTEAQIDAELARMQAEHDSLAYARKRKEEYPELAEQLDLLWHAIDTGTLDDRDHRNKFYSMLKKVKTDNPKG